MKNALWILLFIFGVAAPGCGSQQPATNTADEKSPSKSGSSSGGFHDGPPYYGPNDTDMTVSPTGGSSGADTSGGYEPPVPEKN